MKPLITDMDMKRLSSVLERRGRFHVHEGASRLLEERLNRARVVAASKIPASVVTMNSRVFCTDPASGEDREFTLVYPWAANDAQSCVSVLSPLGVELLGAIPGQTLRGDRASTWRIICLEYQPEALGEFHL